MSTTRIAIVSVGVVSLLLAGLYTWLSETNEARPPEEVIAGPTSRRREPSRAGSTQPRTASSPAETTPPPTEHPGATEISQGQDASGLEEALATARQDATPQQRIKALQFLGEHARQQHLEALQQIQIQDPSPEVRRAAEAAVHLLLARFAGQPWPAIPSVENPVYMPLRD
ncbi:MAG TPA: HEAT repeat domain-containing protein [Archangium sp.]|jgi:HEAT repeat protein|uniref:HEAT repeat domain-containing protein n=1 Tax=Archangium sp. TaxID=1872627 RepID=UPI002EDB94C1